MDKKPSTTKAILCVIPATIAFALAFGITVFIITFVSAVLVKIPLIGDVLGWLFFIRGDTPYMMSCIIGAYLAYFLSLLSVEKMLAFPEQRKICTSILGVCIMGVHILSFVFNILSGEAVFANITQVIAGYFIFRCGK